MTIPIHLSCAADESAATAAKRKPLKNLVQRVLGRIVEHRNQPWVCDLIAHCNLVMIFWSTISLESWNLMFRSVGS